MKHLHVGIGLMTWVLALVFAAPAVAEQQDEAAIRQVQVLQAAAWNRHDARAYADLFAEDGDVVNVVGWRWRGRTEIENKLREGFDFVFAQSTLTIVDVEVKFLSPNAAIAHVRWKMVGARTPPSMPEPREGIQLQILTKQGAGWLIASFQNTNSIPVIPFPKGPTPASCYRCVALLQDAGASL
ncbi:MAG TPA: SgcJ/EcaC family oxidoreductase [Casimicrobiaceae bacterium]|nr:SgcJ/EcaC family oxidoreductase [Casimicrobiaceae bacterium]